MSIKPDSFHVVFYNVYNCCEGVGVRRDDQQHAEEIAPENDFFPAANIQDAPCIHMQKTKVNKDVRATTLFTGALITQISTPTFYVFKTGEPIP